MEDLGQQLQHMLSDPQSLQQLQGLLRSLGQGTPEAPPPPSPQTALGAPGGAGLTPQALGLVTKLAPLLGQASQEDDATRLLRALRPLGAHYVHGIRVCKPAVVRPAEVAGSIHARREGTALRPALAGNSLRSSLALRAGFALGSGFALLALLTCVPLGAGIARVAFFALWTLGAGFALRAGRASVALRALGAGFALFPAFPLRAADVHGLRVRHRGVVRPTEQPGLHVNAGGEGRAPRAEVALVALFTRVALVALGQHEVEYGVGAAAHVRYGCLFAPRDRADLDRRALARRPLHQLCRADVALKSSGRAQFDFDDLHNTTSDAASYTASVSGLSTPMTSPPVNFTRMSSETEPFAGKEKVSD